MPLTDSPLRYPGGKSQLAPLVIDILRENDLFYGHYVEPFAGGSGIACKLLINDYVSQVHLNDVDPAIYAFWHSVLNNTDELCDRIRSVKITVKQWHKEKAIQDQGRKTLIDHGFSTLFLNRTNRSGIIKGGIIGGLEQTGNYPIDCRFNKIDLIAKIRRLASYRDQITLHKLDAAEFLKRILPTVPKKALVNLDPPYFVKGPELYRNHYKPEDHEALARLIGKIKQHWMVTYDDTPETRQLYSGFSVFTHELNYSAQVKRLGVELLVLDPKLVVPPSLRMNDKEVISISRKITRRKQMESRAHFAR